MNTMMQSRLGKVACLAVVALAAQLSAAQTRFVALKATSMVYCPQDNRIYATAAHDAAGSLGNTVCRINPDSGAIEASVFVGDEPHGIVRTADGKTLYVLIAGSKMVRKIDRATLSAGLSFSIGDNQAARRIAPVPELADAVLVQRYNPSVSPQGDNLCVFLKGQTGMDGVPCGSEFGINALLHTEDGPGFSGGSHLPLVTNGYGLILANSGFVIDPEARQNLGRLPVDSNELCIDPVRPVAYEIFNDRTPTLRCWDLQTFRELWEAPLPTWDGPHHLSSPMRWGVYGFAYLDGDYIVCGAWNFGRPWRPVDLAVSRSGFPTGEINGRTFTYTLTVKNLSDSPSNGAFLTDTIPGDVAVLGVTASQGSVTYSDGVVRADLGSIYSHGSATVQVRLNVRNRGSGGYTAVVRSFDPDPDTSNNIFPGPTFTPHAKLALGKVGSGPASDPDAIEASWTGLQRQIGGTPDNLSVEIDGELAIVNHGKTATRPMVVRFYMQDGPSLVVDWASILQEVQVPELAPGEQYTVTLQSSFATDADVVGLFVVANIDPMQANGPPKNPSRRIP